MAKWPPMQTPLKVAVITGGHGFDVPGFYALWHGMPGLDFYPQALEDWAADFGGARDRYDALVFYNYHQDIAALDAVKWGRDVRPSVARLGSAAQGIVVLHHGLVAFQGWDEWSALCGVPDRRFVAHKGVTVRTEVAAADHPITRGLAPWTMVDETYAMPPAGPGTHVLLTTDCTLSTLTLAWTRAHGRARVFCYQSGHDRRVYEQPSYREVLERGVRWAAGTL